MASAQVLPSSVASSKKQEHLQAGKRRLEEFRKKKAADRAKKASSANVSETISNEKQPIEAEIAQVTDTAGAGTSDGHGSAFIDSSSVAINNDNISSGYTQKSEVVPSDDISSSSFSTNDYNSLFIDQPKQHANGQEFKRSGELGFGASLDVNQSIEKKDNYVSNYTGGLDKSPYKIISDQSIALHSQGSKHFSSSISSYSVPAVFEPHITEEKSAGKDYASSDFDSSHVSVSRVSSQNSIGSLLQNEPSYSIGSKPSSLYEDIIRPTAGRKGLSYDSSQNMQSSMNYSDVFSFKPGKENINSTDSSLYGMANGDAQTFGSLSSGFSTPNHVPLYPVRNENNPRRSRPSFLDNLNINRASPETQFQKDEVEKDTFKSSALSSKSMDIQGSSPFSKPYALADNISPFPKLDSLSPSHPLEPSINSVSDSMASGLPKLSVNQNGMDVKHDFYLPKQNEDFSALEQHIEDLTQEKFSLQRGLEAARALAESLAAENTSLTDSYNQQRITVDQLKSDMEILRGEIKAQLVELEAFRNEYANAQLECSAADERAKLLASEVIALEEKALRLRSNELKLERQLENSEAEISSYKKKLSSLEKDRMDLQSTIDALQEEKKLLLSKLRKASAGGLSVDITKSSVNKKDVCTSTEDLAIEDGITATSSEEARDGNFVGAEASTSFILPLNGYSTNDDSFANIPPEQLRMIHNINTVISELALEKQDLVQALAYESSHCSKLKELNNELSRKLESQTQRLELLAAQSMANENVSLAQPSNRDVRDAIPLADEGDEVVERVLGWIMKLFPGGPSKRRTSKLL